MSLVSQAVAAVIGFDQDSPQGRAAVEVCNALGRDPFVLLTIDGVLLRAWQVIMAEELARDKLRRVMFGAGA